jgi:HTH-type transcriptional regulator / antitoxin HigA
MRKRAIAVVFAPGEFIREELEARGWTHAELAKIMGRPLRTINEIIAAKRPITPKTADGLAKAFGTSADVWLNLERAYGLSLIRTGDLEANRYRSRIKGRMGLKKQL